MSRSWTLFIGDMCQAADKIIRYTDGRSRESFFADELIFDATLRNLSVLGEAAKGIPQDVRDRYPNIEWRGIAGLRDILTHAYFGLDQDTLWDVVHNKIPDLCDALKRVELS